ncbi:MAG: hypothetical protein HY691_16550 [Chloroflexi bacterium]|nr:hypothetical protein [Chloroflexota bacterium]
MTSDESTSSSSTSSTNIAALVADGHGVLRHHALAEGADEFALNDPGCWLDFVAGQCAERGRPERHVGHDDDLVGTE